MIKRFCLLLTVLSILAVSPIKAQSKEEKCLQKLTEYLTCVEKQQWDKTLKPMADCAFYAKDAMKLDNEVRILCWYLYIGELIKHDPNNRGDIREYSGLICSYGYKYEGKPKSYGMELIVANAFILNSGYVKEVWKPIQLANALRILTRLEEMNIQPVAEKDYEPFYILSGLSVSDAERLKMMQYTIQLTETLSGLEWFNAAEEALDHRDIEGCPFAALFCVQQSEKKNFPDALALHGYMFENGKVVRKDLDQAAKYYKQAANKGSVWGKVEYASFLINGKIVEKDYSQALQLLNSVAGEPDFLRHGGGYQLGRLYEYGWGVEVNREKAMELYTDSYEKCIWTKLKELSYEGSMRLENRMIEDLIDAEVAGVDINQMSVDELLAIAQRYEEINARSKAADYELQAVKKGSSYSACKVGLKYFDLSKRKNEMWLKYAFEVFEIGSKGNYAPCKYNLAVMHLYGYGTSPNYEKALDLYNKYIEQVSAEGYEDYSDDDYLGTITGTLYYEEATKKGIPLKKVLDDFNNPDELYQWARFRERDSRPEISIYFYTRAAQKGHPKATERLEAFKTKNYRKKNNSKQ